MTLASKTKSLPVREALRARARKLAAVRSFFHTRDVMEVDTFLLSEYAPIDLHIDIFEVALSPNHSGYLHSSPEYAMKRLLAAGVGDIYQLSHVYRKEEQGALHHPVFTLLEWYRIGWTQERFLEELFDLIALFIEASHRETLSYRAAFKRALNLDPFEASHDLLAHALQENNIRATAGDRDEMLNFLWGSCVEPTLGQKGLTLITDYPASQAALAQTTVKDGQQVAQRFEVYAQGIELANGYCELTDSKEQKRRLLAANAARTEIGKPALPVDPLFLRALEVGLPPCYGVAVGFDRLLMLSLQAASIHEVLPLSWGSPNSVA